MKIVETENRIEGYCKIPGFDIEQCVISFSKLNTTDGPRWICSSSMCFPADIEGARRVHLCISKSFSALHKIRAVQDGDWITPVGEILKTKGKIKALIRCRELTGMSLRDAKRAVESIEI